MVSPAVAEPARPDALEPSVAALPRVAGYTLGPAVDRRLLDLGERKGFLSPADHAELPGRVAFAQQRSLDKLQAEAVLQPLLAATLHSPSRHAPSLTAAR